MREGVLDEQKLSRGRPFAGEEILPVDHSNDLGNPLCLIVSIVIENIRLKLILDYTEVRQELPDKNSNTIRELLTMKLVVRASILCLAVVGAIAGVASSHSAKAQSVTVSHLAVSAAMPAPICEPGTPCKLHGR